MSSSSPVADAHPPRDVIQTCRESSATERIAKYTVISSLTGATLTAIYESTRGRARAIRELEARHNGSASSAPPFAKERVSASQLRELGKHVDAAKYYRHNTALLSAAAALNSGLVAAAFFSLRELVISPALSSARSRTGQAESVGRPLTWSSMRKHHLEDSAITGALLGGAFNAWKKGPRSVLPGAFTASLACTTLQLLVNEFDVQRVRFVSRSQQPRPASFTTPSSSEFQPEKSSSTDSAVTAPVDSQASTATDSDQRSFGERMLALIGITKIDDAEYLRRLKAKRDKHLARIRELEAQIEEERRNSGGADDRPDHEKAQ